jgi:excisionase family DNA binding protein
MTDSTELPQEVPAKKQSKEPKTEKRLFGRFTGNPEKDDEIRRKEEEERINSILKGYEPHDLSEIKKIIQKVKGQTAKQGVDQKLNAFDIALRKIDLIIKNNEMMFPLLNNAGVINDPDDYFMAVDAANNLKEQFKIEIAELKLVSPSTASPCTEPGMEDKSGKPSVKTSSQTDSPISEANDTNHLSVKEVAEYLRCSPSKIYHMMPKGEIPYHLMGQTPRFIRSEIDEWVKSSKPKTQIPETTKADCDKNGKKKHHFTFKVPLEPFTNVFIEKGYLDNDNARLMNDRFSKSPTLSEEDVIKWEKDVISLITFLYLADRLDYIDKSMSTDVRTHNSSADEYNEDEQERKEIRFQVVVEENFKITTGGSSPSSISRGWKGVHDGIHKLRSDIASKKNIKEDGLTRRKAIQYYFDKKYNISISGGIDKKMLDIVCDIDRML